MEIIPFYFLMAMLFTFVILYITYPNPHVILKYPSVDNEVSDTYVDNNNVCYKYHRRQVPCKKKYI